MTGNDFNIIKPVAGSHNSIPSDRIKREKKHHRRDKKKDKENEKENAGNDQPGKQESQNESDSAQKEQRGYNDDRTNRLDFRA